MVLRVVLLFAMTFVLATQANALADETHLFFGKFDKEDVKSRRGASVQECCLIAGDRATKVEVSASGEQKLLNRGMALSQVPDALGSNTTFLDGAKGKQTKVRPASLETESERLEKYYE